MPASYALPPRKGHLIPPNHTICHVFVGPGTLFEDRHGISRKNIPDGSSWTLMLVEAGPAVPWTKPANIDYDPKQPVRLRGIFPDGVRARMADCSGRWLRADLSQARLHAAITRNGREMPGEDW